MSELGCPSFRHVPLMRLYDFTILYIYYAKSIIAQFITMVAKINSHTYIYIYNNYIFDTN